jgi:hypothetical protein
VTANPSAAVRVWIKFFASSWMKIFSMLLSTLRLSHESALTMYTRKTPKLMSWCTMCMLMKPCHAKQRSRGGSPRLPVRQDMEAGLPWFFGETFQIYIFFTIWIVIDQKHALCEKVVLFLVDIGQNRFRTKTWTSVVENQFFLCNI